jgi:hypothetical protein
MSAAEAEVVGLVSRYLGIEASKVSPASRLFEDLGVDGDDAVELIDAFAARFPTDLGPLYAHWSRHFGPEGWGWPDWRLNCAMAAGLGLVVMGCAGIAPGLTLPLAAAVIVGTIVLAWIAARRALPNLPITVGDLIEAAGTGVWPLRYGDEAPSLP